MNKVVMGLKAFMNLRIIYFVCFPARAAFYYPRFVGLHYGSNPGASLEYVLACIGQSRIVRRMRRLFLSIRSLELLSHHLSYVNIRLYSEETTIDTRPYIHVVNIFVLIQLSMDDDQVAYQEGQIARLHNKLSNNYWGPTYAALP
jgi:hypothetical protein